MYVQGLPGDYLSDILDFVVRTAQPMAEGRDFGVGEEFGVIRLSSGEHLYGIGFKREYAFVEHALQSQPDPARIVATVVEGKLVPRRGGLPIGAPDAACFTYRVPSKGP